MDKKYIIIIATLIIVNGIFASLIIYERLTASRVIEPMDSTRQELRDSLRLDIKISKTNYKTGETINNGYLDGQYFVEYSGTPFEAIILYAHSRDGFRDKYYTIEKRLIEDMSGSLGHPMDIFRLDENSYASNQKYFYDAGIYIYSFAVYDCVIIEGKLNKLCENISLDDVDNINKIEPLRIASKNIIVTEENKKIVQTIPPAPVNQETKLAANCDAFPDKLSSCTKYRCQFIHPFTGETMEREILGIINEKCNYIEQMPNNGKMECKYTESFRKIVAQYYKDALTAESTGFDISIDLGSGEQKTKYTIDGKEVENPLQEASDSGVCVVSGY